MAAFLSLNTVLSDFSETLFIMYNKQIRSLFFNPRSLQRSAKILSFGFVIIVATCCNMELICYILVANTYIIYYYITLLYHHISVIHTCLINLFSQMSRQQFQEVSCYGNLIIVICPIAKHGIKNNQKNIYYQPVNMLFRARTEYEMDTWQPKYALKPCNIKVYFSSFLICMPVTLLLCFYRQS